MLKQIVKVKDCNWVYLQQAQSMIGMGLVRKCKLESEIKDLENEKAKITKN